MPRQQSEKLDDLPNKPLNKKSKSTSKPTSPTPKPPKAKDLFADAVYKVPCKTVPFTGRQVPAIPTSFVHPALTREEVATRFHLAFELIGGVERFAYWADENPTEYYRMYSKLLPENKDTNVTPQELTINLGNGFGIPKSPLDEVQIRNEIEVNARYLNDKTDDKKS